MINQVLNLLLKREVADLRRRSAGGLLLVAGFLLFLLAGLLGLVALYLYLSTRIEPWQSALSVSALLVLLGGILALAGRAKVRRHHKMRQELDAYMETLLSSSGVPEKNGKEASIGMVTLAAMVGIIIGRQIRK
ncbi:MAG: phage holin family protein [Anderseniella sp.]|jgi:TRAP-type uncharacterized transport system fused permease subunit|nr:phage holin family protein [Anderseniella sp.]